MSGGEVGPPPGVVTVTSTAPAACGGVGNVRLVAELTSTSAASTVMPPIVTVVWPSTKPLPVIVTDVPPMAGPSTGTIPVAVGTGR